MATTTPNYGWTVPTSTDLVKDGATAIETLGDAIDASMNTALGTKKAGMVLLNTTSFSGVASQAVNSVFSSTYQNYKILINIASSTGDINSITMKLRVTTTDTSTGYSTRRMFANGATANASADPAGTDEWFIGESDKDVNGVTGIVLDLQSPNEARPTNFQAIASTADGSFYCHLICGNQSSSTQFDGINIINSAGNTTGTIRVYGYNN
jgi:hypothetical protein